MIRLRNVYEGGSTDNEAIQILWELLAERTPEQSISHQEMPTFKEHQKFVRGHPYRAWYLILDISFTPVGSVYLTRQNEIGIFIFKAYQRKGYAKEGIAELQRRYPEPMLANINPANEPSRALFEKLGGKMIQVTYRF